jgi:hypothetical protein
MTKISMMILGSLAVATGVALAVFSPRNDPQPQARPQLTSVQAAELKTPEKPAPPAPALVKPAEDDGGSSAADYADAEDGPGS